MSTLDLKKDICKTILFFLLPWSALAQESSPFTLHIQGSSIEQLEIFPSKTLMIESGVESNTKGDQVTLIAEKDSILKIGMPVGRLYISATSVGLIQGKELKDRSLFVSLKQGVLKLSNTGSLVHISLDEGQIELEDMEGVVKIESHLASISVKKMKGKLQVRSYSGSVDISEVEGDLDINTFESPIQLSKNEGQLHFRTEKSLVHIRKFLGNVNGYSNKGDIKGFFTPIQAQIRTETGLIRLYFQNSKAHVTAQSWAGQVHAPRNFYKSRAGGIHKVSGRIQDRGNQDGKVTLTSQEGKILVL